MPKQVAVPMVVLVASVLVVGLLSGCKPAPSGASGPAGPVAMAGDPESSPMLTCPVTGTRMRQMAMLPAKVGSSTYYVCCGDCAENLRLHPDRYAAGTERQAGELKANGKSVADGERLASCPVCGGQGLVKDMKPIEIQGKMHYACCNDCLGCLKRNPGQYIRGLKPSKPEAKPKPTPKPPAA